MASFILCCGCNKPAVPASSEKKTSPEMQSVFYLDHAQPKLHTIKLWLGAQELIAECATNNIQRNTGMMYREQMAENEAMLFVFPAPMEMAFYMRNTRIPLSCAYIDSEGVIQEIYDMKPLEETPISSVSDKIQYVLEVRQGWFGRNKISPGTSVRTELGTLNETFFGRRKF